MVREHDLTELELERDGFKIRVKKEGVSVVAQPGPRRPGPGTRAGCRRAAAAPPVVAGRPGRSLRPAPAAAAPPPVPTRSNWRS